MKQKPSTDTVSWTGGITFGMLLMYLFWWLLTGMEHLGALAGGGVILILTSIVGRVVQKRARQ